MAHPLCEKYPNDGDPHITIEQIDMLEAAREMMVFIDPYEDLPAEAIIPRSLRVYAGLSRQCMQTAVDFHLECLAGTRNSCICLCHKENRSVDDSDIEELLDNGS